MKPLRGLRSLPIALWISIPFPCIGSNFRLKSLVRLSKAWSKYLFAIPLIFCLTKSDVTAFDAPSLPRLCKPFMAVFAAISPRECLPSTSKKPSLGPADFVFLFFYEAKFSDLAALACAPEHQSIVFARFIPKTEHIPFLFFLSRRTTTFFSQNILLWTPHSFSSLSNWKLLKRRRMICFVFVSGNTGSKTCNELTKCLGWGGRRCKQFPFQFFVRILQIQQGGAMKSCQSNRLFSQPSA